ncbi:MAG TPA: hypothetical protein EYP10_10485, partial [Armatimonadetes bacterium]|nr:hypothetical protein [Armatimonadota bacterium]
MANPPLVQGRIGLFVRGCEAVFDDVSAIHWDGSPQLQQRPHVKIAEQFQRERTMELWASPTGDWVDGGNEDGWRILWHRGDFFGDASISASLQLPTNSAGELKLLLYATPPRIDNGYSLTIRLYANGDEPSYELMVSKRMLKRGKLPLERFNGHWGGQLIFSHTANHLSVKVDEALISTVDVQGITHGLKVGVAMRGINIPHDAFTVTCTNLLDDTFACAPTDWWALRGLWIVFPRWPCDPSWGWFGGVNSESPVLWTKQAFYGDMTVEAFMALPMDLPTTPGYSHPSDLNITICGDGRNLDSGYSFIFAGWRNTKTAILRHEKVVAVTPNMRMRNPINTNMEFHRHWFYLRIERRGSKLRYFV